MQLCSGAILSLLLAGCAANEPTPNTLQPLSIHTTVRLLPGELVNSLTEAPDVLGALGRNKAGYFHVRFQLTLASNAAYAIFFTDDRALLEVANSIDYSFSFQKPGGDFEIRVPGSLQALGPPSEADLAGGTAFFGAALGTALVLLQQSPWYQGLSNTGDGKLRIQNNTARVQRMLTWLLAQEFLLQTIDARAANRLFWNARCFYSLGEYLNDNRARAAGLRFLAQALALQDNIGFFRENDGFDSSYNAVSLFNGLQVFALLPAGADQQKLGDALLRAAAWQRARVLPTGEIDTRGNTRVFPGGEAFLGEEKSVAAKDAVLAFYWLHNLAAQPEDFKEIAERVKRFYE